VNNGGTVGTTALNTSSVNRLVAEYGAKAQLAPATGPNRLSPHDLRRTFARNAYDNGAPLPAIQRALGHADVSTTMQ
jgi:integrase